MKACLTNPGEATKACPPEKVLNQFNQASFRPETRKAASEQNQRGDVNYH